MSKRILRVDIPIGHINEDLIKEISFMLLMNPGLGVNTRVVEKKSNHSKKTKKPRTESYVMLEKTPPDDGTPQTCAWQCLDYDDGFTRGKYRAESKSACGKYNILTTKKRDGNRHNQWQNKCRHCGKRTQLNDGKVLWFPNRLHAKIYAEMKNRE